VLSFFRTSTTYNKQGAYCIKLQRVPGLSDTQKRELKIIIKKDKVGAESPRSFMDEVCL